MATKFSGTKSALYLQAATGGTSLLALCGRQITAQREREVVEVTTTAGDEVGHVVGIKRGVVSFNNLSLFLTTSEGTTGFSDVKVKEWWADGTKLFGQIIDDPAGNDIRVIEEFFCYIRSYSINRNNNEIANFDCELVITAEDSPVPQPDYCPVVTVIRRAKSLLLTWEGTAGIYYTFEILPYLSDTVTGAPYESEFTGLTPDTAYTIVVSVYDYATGTTTECASITTSTTAVNEYAGFGGDTVEDACDEINPITVYTDEPVDVGVILYSDSGLTTPFTTYEYVKLAGIVYQINTATGEVIDIIGACGGNTVYSYMVGSGSNPCGTEIQVFSLSPTFVVGTTLFTDQALTAQLVDDPYASVFTDFFPPLGVLAGTVNTEGEIWNFVSGTITGTTGTVC